MWIVFSLSQVASFFLYHCVKKIEKIPADAYFSIFLATGCFQEWYPAASKPHFWRMFILNTNSSSKASSLNQNTSFMSCVCMKLCASACAFSSVMWQHWFFLKATMVSKSRLLWSFAALGRPLTFHVTLALCLSYTNGHKAEISCLNNLCYSRLKQSMLAVLVIELITFFVVVIFSFP